MVVRDARVLHQLLLDGGRRVRIAQPRPVAVTKCMPSDITSEPQPWASLGERISAGCLGDRGVSVCKPNPAYYADRTVESRRMPTIHPEPRKRRAVRKNR
jgi:hypothetical protein